MGWSNHGYANPFGKQNLSLMTLEECCLRYTPVIQLISHMQIKNDQGQAKSIVIYGHRHAMNSQWAASAWILSKATHVPGPYQVLDPHVDWQHKIVEACNTERFEITHWWRSVTAIAILLLWHLWAGYDKMWGIHCKRSIVMYSCKWSCNTQSSELGLF